MPMRAAARDDVEGVVVGGVNQVTIVETLPALDPGAELRRSARPGCELWAWTVPEARPYRANMLYVNNTPL